jgi:hypothetical protein
MKYILIATLFLFPRVANGDLEKDHFIVTYIHGCLISGGNCEKLFDFLSHPAFSGPGMTLEESNFIEWQIRNFDSKFIPSVVLFAQRYDDDAKLKIIQWINTREDRQLVWQFKSLIPEIKKRGTITWEIKDVHGLVNGIE